MDAGYIALNAPEFTHNPRVIKTHLRLNHNRPEPFGSQVRPEADRNRQQ